jgi:hypothetical protein
VLLRHSVVQRRITILSYDIHVCTAVDQGLQLIDVPAHRSHVNRIVSEEADLIDVACYGEIR